jgi:ABC-type dipeptide/oligopeptide/nickel transport system permease subunit
MDAPDEGHPDTAVAARLIGGWIGVVVLLMLLGIALAKGGAASATRIDLPHRLAAPSSSHVLGTDHFGRDELARIAAALAPTARVSAIATALIGGFALAMGFIGLLVRQVLPDTRAVRWTVGILAGFAWLVFVHWMWRLPFVASVDGPDLSWKVVHAVHDATLAQVSARLFAATCIGISTAIALEGLRLGELHWRRTVRHLVGAFVLLFGLGCASLSVVELMGMLGLGAPHESLIGVFGEEIGYRHDHGHAWIIWPALAAIALVLVACALIGAWLMATRHTDPDAPPVGSWQHRTAIGLTSVGIALALARQLLLPTITAGTASLLQWLAAAAVVVALVLLVVGRVQRGARGVDLGTATFFVLGGALAVLLHWPAQHLLDTSVRADLGDHRAALSLLRPER